MAGFRLREGGSEGEVVVEVDLVGSDALDVEISDKALRLLAEMKYRFDSTGHPS